MKEFTQLKKNLKKDFSNLKKIKIALLGDTATQFLNQALKGLGFDNDLNLDISEADFNQIDRQIFDSSSELYEFSPEYVIVFQSSHKLINKYNKLTVENQINLAETEIDSISSIYQTIIEKLSAKVIFYNYTEIDDSIFQL